MKLKVIAPILGFDDVEYATIEEIDSYFYSLGYGELVFTLLNPNTIMKYDFLVPSPFVKSLEIESTDEIEVYNIVTVCKPIEDSTINLLAPLVVNKTKGLMAQVVLDEGKYPSYGLKESMKNFL